MTGPQQMTFKRLVLEVIKDDETTIFQRDSMQCNFKTKNDLP